MHTCAYQVKPRTSLRLLHELRRLGLDAGVQGFAEVHDGLHEGVAVLTEPGAALESAARLWPPAMDELARSLAGVNAYLDDAAHPMCIFKMRGGV